MTEKETSKTTASSIISTIWNIGDGVLRNRIEKKDWDRILLPFIVLRRLDCLLTNEYSTLEKKLKDHNKIMSFIKDSSRHKNFYNSWIKKDHISAGGGLAYISKTSKDIRQDLTNYVRGYNEDVVSIFEALELLPSESVTSGTIDRLNAKTAGAGIDLLQTFLAELVKGVDFTEIAPTGMGDIFEECLRRFNEEKKTDAGEHYTPRDAIRLLTRLLLNGDVPAPGATIEFYDPTCGTGGILLEGKDALEQRCLEKGVKVNIDLFGQELMSFTHGICQADLLLRNAKFQQIKWGDTLAKDEHNNKKFKYQGANPPYGVKWKAIETIVRNEVAKGKAGRFPFGAPKTVQEGQLLFLQHMVSKMKPREEGGGRIAVVMNGNPLFAADAGEGDSNIRRELLKNDLVEAIIALPKEMFFNTGIATYIWVLNNNKNNGKPYSKKRMGHVQLIDASKMGTRLSKSIGNKRYELTEETTKLVSKWHEQVAGEEVDERCKLVPNDFFGYWSVDIEEAPEKGAKKGNKETERIPLLDCPDGDEQELHEIIKTMRPNDAPDFEIKSKVDGWEIPFTQIFYKYEAPEDPLILAKKVEEELAGLHIDTSFFAK
jgi:type I restriction enzyme M protein